MNSVTIDFTDGSWIKVYQDKSILSSNITQNQANKAFSRMEAQFGRAENVSIQQRAEYIIQISSIK